MDRAIWLLGLAVVAAACSEQAPVAEDLPITPEPAEKEDLYEFTDDSTFEPIGPASEGDDQTSDVAAISDDGVVFRFVGPFEGGAALVEEDDFTANLQPREIALRTQSLEGASFDHMVPLYKDDVFAWPADQKAALAAVIEESLPVINQIDQHLPDEVLLILTGAVVEGGLPHTRRQSIIFAGGGFPVPGVDDPGGEMLQALFLHELHHVLSRANSDQHDAYYRLIGFMPCALEEPEGLRAVRLTNPDAPTYAHYAPVPVEGADGVVPFLHTAHSFTKEVPSRLGDVFSFGLIPVRYANGVCSPEIGDAAGLLDPINVPGFAELSGGNTDYLIHPEETLADNFVYWAMGRTDLPSPEIPEAVGRFWLRLED
ncbi:MAG: hypothetical protein AAFR65_12075 [Pseudomonadota bacterium]